MKYSSYNLIMSNYLRWNKIGGICLYGSEHNELENNIICDNTCNFRIEGQGIDVDAEGCIVYCGVSGLAILPSSPECALYFINCSDITISGFDLAFEIYFCNTHYSTITGNRLKELVLDGSNYNVIYNNYFNNSNNVLFVGACTGNKWNITKTEGTNIIGGPYLGGNYWATPENTGFSEHCIDADGDRLSDDPYAIRSTDIDYHPLCYDRLEVIEIPFNKDDGRTTAERNETLTYLIGYENTLSSALSGVVINDELSEEVEFISASDGGVYDPPNHKVPWDIGLLPSGTSGFVELNVKVIGDAGQTILNEVSLSADQPVSETAEDETAIVDQNGGQNIPEFPSVAVPLFAVLGLMAVFGRKKDNI